MKHSLILCLSLSLAACNEAQYSATLTRPLSVEARDTVLLPAGDYRVDVSGSAVSKVKMTSSRASAEFKVKTSAAKKFRDFLSQQRYTSNASLNISAAELNQPFSLNLSRASNRARVGSARNEDRSCVLRTERVRTGESCHYDSFCQTETVCRDRAGFEVDQSRCNFAGDCECHSRPIDSSRCTETCSPTYEDRNVYGEHSVRVRDITYQVVTQSLIVQSGVRVGAIQAIANSVQDEEILTSGQCH